MKQQALISIIIPVFNRAGIVGRTLDSIAAQTLRPLNIILVDNNSSDNSFDVLNQWEKDNDTDDVETEEPVVKETNDDTCDDQETDDADE